MKKQFCIFFFSILALCAICIYSTLAEDAVPAKPTSHVTKEIEGWTVKIDQRLFDDEHRELGERAARILGDDLYRIKMQIPADKVAKLTGVVIWLDLTHGKLKSAQYHPSADWLKNNGYSPELAKCVHFPDAADFASNSMHRVQPWFVLHELSHAYHDQFLPDGFNNADIKQLWQKTSDAAKYEKTLHVDGHETKHYALTDPMEFFAEFTEAYYGVNDFFPFVRGELKKDAPEILELIRSKWENSLTDEK
ncbi:MAG: metallopeptidase [Thermoguttaceae bacterium]